MLKQLSRSGPSFSKALFAAGLLGGAAVGVITIFGAPAQAFQVFPFEGVRQLDGDILKLKLTTEDNTFANLKT